MPQAMRQLNLFEDKDLQLVMRAGGLVSSIKAVMRDCLDKSALSRPQAVDRMNAIAAKIGRRLTQGKKKGISLDTLDKWLNPNEIDHVPNMLALQVFMLALDTIRPLEAWLALFDCGVLSHSDKVALEYTKVTIRSKADAKRRRELEKALMEQTR